MNNDKIKTAKEWIQKMANGINPIDGSIIPSEDIVNNIHISRCLFYVADILDDVIKKSSKGRKDYELDFNLNAELKSKVKIFDKTGIAVFVREINKVIPDNMRPIRYSKIINWLISNKYLEENEKKKIPTDTGKAIGISAGIKEGPNGTYWAVEYTSSAQRFIIDNINSIAEQ
ncbi:MAG: hypothetical protein ACI3Y4_01670 [Candidatus Cryptobacteroides sp.]